MQLIHAPSAQHKALGLHWDTSQDSLHVATPILAQGVEPTKRQILSDVSQTFDVLGWFSPVTILIKIMIQKIWMLKLGWDDVVPPDLARIWSTWRERLHLVTEVPISRYYHRPSKEMRDLQLHGFADSSEAAYGGVVFLRATYTDDSVSTTLVLAKAKVVPLKMVTIPKLELCAALLTSKLINTARTQLNVDPQNVNAWSDSTITLQWLGTSPHKLNTFVANRVTAISEKLPSSHWRHLPSGDNPADVNSRGMPIDQLLECSLWWDGPPWLKEPPGCWPSQHYTLLGPLPKLKSHALTIRAEETKEFLVTRYSSFNKLTSVLSWICRFTNNCRSHSGDKVFSPQLSPEELLTAEKKLIRLHQQRHFSQELSLLKAGLCMSRRSPLRHLKPILDADGLIQVGGRLDSSHLSHS